MDNRKGKQKGGTWRAGSDVLLGSGQQRNGRAALCGRVLWRAAERGLKGGPRICVRAEGQVDGAALHPAVQPARVQLQRALEGLQ